MQQTLKLIKELQDATGAKAKAAILQENRDNETFKRVLYYACHPRLTYKVSEETLRDIQHASYRWNNPIDIFAICEMFAKKKALNNEDIEYVRDFLAGVDKEYVDVFRQIFAKTLRLGVTHKSINKSIHGLFPEWEVQQAYPIEKHPFKDGTWFSVSEKLNGVRCTFYRGQLIGRSGEPFTGLEHIADELTEYPNLVFDGELTLKDKTGLTDNEAFRKATGIINSDEEDKTEICLTIFDMLTVDEFDSGTGIVGYKARREQLDLLQDMLGDTKHVKVLQSLYAGTDQRKIDELLELMVQQDKEGCMVNLDVPYKCKRHSGILKVKRFYTMDLPIIRVEEGSGKYAGTTGALVVDYKGNEVGVGTGLTDEQRVWFWHNRNEVISELAEIKYKEISSDKKTGAESLQFPVFVQLRTDKSEVSYG